MTTSRSIIPRGLARQDVEDALTYYLSETSERIALGFLDTLEHAYAHLAHFPETGSSRYAYELQLPGLRAWALGTYPYVIFYILADGNIDVWRILHASRDIPAWLSSPE
ncbi:type II toxin-antitoxin system RelE/ParE family toxin [Castellaniella sp.]|uniref:type II toxin-antitoxin system RelE/ParE family toxin n=1 Tax=Castellaniella sp. TaxID=1955812 RepID=UPI002B001B40|nr:type II toxin-antitoxin system RelE/ParE family toxin [Castellaniella sp.]